MLSLLLVMAQGPLMKPSLPQFEKVPNDKGRPLEQRRFDFFDRIVSRSEDGDLGYYSGLGETLESTILFPAGRADRVIFVAHDFYPKEAVRLTSYVLSANRPKLAWMVRLEKSKKRVSGSAGTLHRFVQEWLPGFRIPETNNADLSRFANARWPMAHYVLQKIGGVSMHYVPENGVPKNTDGRDWDSRGLRKYGFPTSVQETTFLKRRRATSDIAPGVGSKLGSASHTVPSNF